MNGKHMREKGRTRQNATERGAKSAEGTGQYLARDRHHCAPARARIFVGSSQQRTAKAKATSTSKRKWTWAKAGRRAPQWPFAKLQVYRMVDERDKGEHSDGKGPKEALLF